ncbi:hypothetical protein D9756_002435 [Leucocoprinus leucothites]|uniref:RNA polymerase-associated protein LEO1 n=1 Tax=Leucocoprinus leucothites TaxID=201217 RepID=A0A8H5LLY4_9AGAR|nr:hypothetical protein D9756_002435 [Leucoagaricus leucothites]
MSSLSGALDESGLKPAKLDPAFDDAEMHLESHHSTSESDDADAEEQDEEMADLFGNEDEEEPKPDRSAAASPTASGPESDRLPTPERERRQALEYEEDEIPPDTGEVVKEADVSFPNLPIPKSSDGNNWVIRMPNFVKMDTKPFHPDTYLGPEEEDSMQAESLREKSMTIKLKVENTVRWRWIKDANGLDKRQSNSRIIRWSDGTLSLLLGKELFDITQSIDTSAGIPRQVAGTSTSQSQSQLQQSQSQTPGLKSQGLTYLVAQHKRSQVLQSEAVVTGYMSLRPTGMQSETHRMLVRAVGQKHSKVARLRMAPDPTMDPERDLKELAKQSAKKSRRKNDIDDFGSGRRRRQSRRTTDTGALWSSDEDAGGEYDNYDDEDDDGAGSSTRKGKRKAATKERTKTGEDYQEDDFVVADSSDEEGVPKKKPKNTSDAEDDLDRLDAQIEEQDTNKRKKPGKSGNASDETDEDGMDVESEEEDDDFKVRRSGGGRKRTHISMDEDEE